MFLEEDCRYTLVGRSGRRGSENPLLGLPEVLVASLQVYKFTSIRISESVLQAGEVVVGKFTSLQVLEMRYSQSSQEPSEPYSDRKFKLRVRKFTSIGTIATLDQIPSILLRTRHIR